MHSSGIILHNITKKFGSFKALDHVNLELSKGELMVIVGPSGCGKSTILRLIAGLDPVTDGRIRIETRDVTEMEPSDRDVAMVFQNYALYPHMTVFDNMAFGLKIRKVSRPEREKRVRKTASVLGLEALLERKPADLSGGQRQRVALGRAIIKNPKVFLFDEPLSNLDAKLRNEMRAEILQLHKRMDATIIYVTHDQVEAMTLGDRICVLNDGRVMQVGTPENIYHFPENKFVASFIGSPSMNMIEGTLREKDTDIEFIATNGESLMLSLFEKARLFPDFLNQKITLGVRPAAIQLVQDGDMKSRVDMVELIGEEKLVHFHYANTSMVAALPSDTSIKAEDLFSFQYDSERIFLFGEHGNRIKV